MTPLDSYLSIMNTFANIGRCFGITPFYRDYRPNYRTWLSLALNFAFVTMSIYTLVEYPRSLTMQCAACLTFSFQGPVKVHAALAYYELFNKTHEKIINLYQSFERSSNLLFAQKLYRFARILRQLVILYTFMVVSALFVLVAVAMLMVTGEFYPILPTFLPYVDETKLRGFLITVSFQFAAMIFGGCGQILADGLFLLTVAHVWPMCDMFELSVQDLNRSMDLLMSRLSSVQFRNVLLMHREYYVYTSNMSETYYYIGSVDTLTNAMTMCTLIYTFITSNWVAGYLMFVMMFGKLTMYCLLGTFVEHGLKCYNLTVAQQRQYVVILHLAQNPRCLMSGFKRMEMELYVSVLKSVYSMTMVLLEMVD